MIKRIREFIQRWRGRRYRQAVQRLNQIQKLNAAETQTNTPIMNQGDYHSGPLGYSPNTAYPETQYGRMFDFDDPDAEADEYWNEGYSR